jgi:hypothetical protein
MGRAAPFAFPNTRRAGEAMALGTGWPGSHTLVASLVFGLPVITQHVSVTAQGTGAGLVKPQGVVLAKVLAEGAGLGLVKPQGVALAAVRAEGAGAGRVTPQGVVLASVTALGQGEVQLRADVGSAVGVTAEGRATLALRTVTLRPTLLDKLAPRIAGLRATLTKKIGDRPYRVYVVTTTWAGGAPGRGEQARVRIELGCGVDRKTGMIMPPKIENAANPTTNTSRYAATMRGLTPSSDGSDTVYVSQIDPTLVERDFIGFVDLAQDQESYVEIEHTGSSGGIGEERPVRRYRVAGAPRKDALGMQWLLALVPQEPSKTFGGRRRG